MTRGILLDTHAWLWLFADSHRVNLSAQEQIAKAANNGLLFIAVYSLFKAVYAAQRKKLAITMPIDIWLAALLLEPSVEIIPLTPAIALASTRLPFGFHGDPGDRLITATAIERDLTLCTHDGDLLRFTDQGLFTSLEI